MDQKTDRLDDQIAGHIAELLRRLDELNDQGLPEVSLLTPEAASAAYAVLGERIAHLDRLLSVARSIRKCVQDRGKPGGPR